MSDETRAAPARRKAPRRWSQEQSRFVYKLAQLIMAIFFKFWVRCYRFIGLEHVPASGGAFLVANHTTGMDPFILGGAISHRMMAGPGKVELFRNPIVAYLMRKLGIFPLRIGQADAGAVRTMVDLYRHDRVIIVYPEGGRSDSGEMRSFNPDFARLVIKLKAPVIPTAIAGGRELLPVGSLIPRPRKPVVVAIGECFELSQYYGSELTPDVLREASVLLFDRVATLLVEARREREIISRNC